MDGSVVDVLAAAGAWLVVVVLPGTLVLVGLRPRAGVVRTLALAPVVGYGVVMSVGIALSVTHVPVRLATVAPWALAVAVVAAVLGLGLGGRRRGIGPVRPSAPWRARDVVPLVVATVGVAVCWLSASGLLTLVPANDDGSNHGLFTTQVMRLHTLAPDQVVVGDVLTGQPHGDYYPLAMHLVAALMSEITGLPVATSLDMSVLGALLVMPLGMMLLARRLFPARPGAAVVAALLVVVFPAFPAFVTTWGGFPYIVAMAFVPATVEAVRGSGQDDGPPASVGVALGLALVGLFALHTSEAVTALLLGGLLLVAALLRREVRVSAAVVAVGASLLVLAAFVLPQLGQVVAGAGKVGQVALIDSRPWSESVVDAVMALARAPAVEVIGPDPAWRATLHVVVAVLLWALVAIGALVAARRRWSPEWVLALLGVLALTIASSMRLPGVDALTVPWYSRWDRLVFNEVVVIPPLAGLGIVTLAALVVRTTAEPWGTRARCVGSGVLAALLVGPLAWTSWRTVHAAFDNGSLAGTDQRAAFDWLAAHVRPGERVLNDPADGSAWMWALNSVPPAFAVAPHQIDGWGDRGFLANHVARVDSDPRARAAADQYDVQWAYVGPRVYPGNDSFLDVPVMTSLGQWRVVATFGGATVLARTSTLR